MSYIPYTNFSEFDDRVALCIGVNTYLNHAPLNYAVSDAQEVAEVLRNFGDFKKVKVITDDSVPTQKVTLTQIEDGLRWLFGEAKSENTLLLLYFSGHAAETATGQLYLLPGDARPQGQSFKHFDTLRFEEIRNFIEPSRAGAMVILLDTCYSGACSFLPRGVDVRTNFRLHIIGASHKNQESKESSQAKHGVFTHYLLEAFQYLTATRNGWISSDRVETYIEEESKLAGWEQKPWPFRLGSALPLVREGYQGEIPPVQGPTVYSHNDISNQQPPAQEYYPDTIPSIPHNNYSIIGVTIGFIIAVVFLLAFGVSILPNLFNTKNQSPTNNVNVSSLPNSASPGSLSPSDTTQIVPANGINLNVIPMDQAITLPTLARLYAMDFIPNSKNKFVATGEDGTVSKWVLEPNSSQSRVIKLEASIHISEPTNPKLSILSKALSIAPDGKSAAVAKTNGFSIVDIQNELKVVGVSRLADEHKARVEGLSFSPDGKKLATVSSDRVIKIWDVSNLKEPRLATSIFGQASYSVTFVDNNTILTGDGDGEIRVWDINTRKNISPNGNGVAIHKGSWAYWISIAPGQYQGKSLVASVSGYTKDTTPSPSQTAEAKLVLLSLPNTSQVQSSTIISQPLVPYTLPEPEKQNEWMYSTAFSPDGRFLAIAYGSGNVKVWSISSFQLLKDETITSSKGGKRITAMAFSSDGQWLVAGNDKGEVFAWEVSSGKGQVTYNHGTQTFQSSQ